MNVNAWEADARAGGLGDYQVDALVRMFEYYDRNGFTGDPAALTGLIGRTPTSLDAFVAR